MGKSLQMFLEYKANNPDVKPLFQLPVFASMRSELPKYLDDWPRGKLIVYPDFLAFLTLVQGDPGQESIWKRVIRDTVESTVALYRINKMITNPLNIVTEIARHMESQYQHEDTLGKALANPNSIFVPLDEITYMSTGHKWGNCDYIKLSAPDKEMIICEDVEGEMANAPGFFGGIKFAFTSTFDMLIGKKWHPELVSWFEKRVKANLTKKE